MSGPASFRTSPDEARERHDRELMEEIRRQNENPFQRISDAVTSRWLHAYNNYLYSSGVLLAAFCFWSVYPSYVRFRHLRIMRYHRHQLVFRRWFFASNHMPKWDKKYLQEVVVPPLPEVVPKSVGSILNAQQAAATRATNKVDSSLGTEEVACAPNAVSVHVDQAVTLSPAEKDALFSRTQNLQAISALHAGGSARSTFAKGESQECERAFAKALQHINEIYYKNDVNRFTEQFQARPDPQQLTNDIKEAVKQARSKVVLIETHDTVGSIPKGYEVWWLSADEARRTRFCKFWIGGLLFARVLQDLLDMPEMPDFVQ